MRIRELRIENKWTQKELGEKIQSTAKNIWAYESGLAVPPLDVLIRLADCFTCSIDYLVGRADDFDNVNLTLPAESGLSAKELHLLQNYRSISKNLQVRVQEYVQTLMKLNEKEREVWGSHTPPSL